jgi:signal transduction histidine kinase
MAALDPTHRPLHALTLLPTVAARPVAPAVPMARVSHSPSPDGLVRRVRAVLPVTLAAVVPGLLAGLLVAHDGRDLPLGVAVAVLAGFAVLAFALHLRSRDAAVERALVAMTRERDRIAVELERTAAELRWTRTAVRGAHRDGATVDTAASLAHEMSGPLTGIVTRAELALEELAPGDPGAAALASAALAAVRDDARRAVTIARTMLARSRGERTVVRVFDLGTLAASVATWHRMAAGRPDITIDATVMASPAVPGQPAPTVVRADPVAVEQVLDNLVANAIAAMPHGGAIRVAVVAGHGHVEVRVTDDGIGMSADTLSRAFDQHFTTRGAAGTGLGLTISRSLAEAQGGNLTAVSARGRGTTMTLRLPALDAPLASVA